LVCRHGWRLYVDGLARKQRFGAALQHRCKLAEAIAKSISAPVIATQATTVKRAIGPDQSRTDGTLRAESSSTTNRHNHHRAGRGAYAAWVDMGTSR